MNYWEIIILGIGLSMDAAAVSLCNGLMETNIRARKALGIALLFGVFQGIMPILGYYLGSLVSQFLQDMTVFLASGLLIFLGTKMIYEEIKHKNDLCVVSTTPVLFSQAFATSIDAFLVGFTFVLMQVSIYPASSIIAIVTAIICFGAVFLGKRFGNILKNKAVLFGGLILMAIGVKILIQGLLN
ncbi:MAG: manganese efflux pump MntP family protein [Bacilli bacterium]